jgi:hypothetical protein
VAAVVTEQAREQIMMRYRVALEKLEGQGRYTLADAVDAIEAATDMRNHVIPHLPAAEQEAVIGEARKVLDRLRARSAGQ